MTFTIYGAPATKGSSVSFLGENGKVVTKPDCKNLAAWSQAVAWAARGARVPLAPTGTPVAVRAIFQSVRPKRQQQRRYPVVRPDLDKTARALLDALAGIGFADDCQVVRLWLDKVYGDDVRTTVTVTPWMGENGGQR
jgi:crossover junction endodeoxyribonuclease RusA